MSPICVNLLLPMLHCSLSAHEYRWSHRPHRQRPSRDNLWLDPSLSGDSLTAPSGSQLLDQEHLFGLDATQLE
ncbi:hypothetical protein B0O80DRAFT_442690 [Mortierella sp. GBAus27b]|nr:hypothetical protein B0O80DRAFT_442690 [Mortierella sp. GBAus27b]